MIFPFTSPAGLTPCFTIFTDCFVSQNTSRSYGTLACSLKCLFNTLIAFTKTFVPPVSSGRVKKMSCTLIPAVWSNRAFFCPRFVIPFPSANSSNAQSQRSHLAAIPDKSEQSNGPNPCTSVNNLAAILVAKNLDSMS
jgi:hypothetical protein